VSDPLTPLESAVLGKLLAHDGEPFDTLRQQLAHSSVSKREFSGVGFLHTFPFQQRRRFVGTFAMQNSGTLKPRLLGCSMEQAFCCSFAVAWFLF